MKRKLMIKQESQIRNFIQKRIKEKPIGYATKYTIDSVINNTLRLLTSKSITPIPMNAEFLYDEPDFLGPDKSLGHYFARFNIWGKSEDRVVLLRNASSELGVEKDQIKEGKVFVNFENKTFEITEFVRQEIKNHYVPLLKREYQPSSDLEEST